MTRLRYIAVLTLLLITFVAPAPALSSAARPQGTIVDDSTGNPLAARISLQDSCGKTLEIEGTHSHVDYLGTIYFRLGGAKVREEASSRCLEKYVSGTIHWLEGRPPFANEADRDEASKRTERALAYYQFLLPHQDPLRR